MAEPSYTVKGYLPQADRWQPIETAPRHADEYGLTPRIVIGFAPDEENYTLPSVEGFWRDMGSMSGWRSCMDPGNPWPLQPTHWMPLPAPPGIAANVNKNGTLSPQDINALDVNRTAEALGRTRLDVELKETD